MNNQNKIAPKTLGGWGKNNAGCRKESPVPQRTDMTKVMKRRAVEESIAAKKQLEEWGIA